MQINKGIRILVVLTSIVTILSCSTDIDSVNPFDPDSPKTIQAKGEIAGVILPEDVNDLQNVNFLVTLKDTSYNSIVEKNGKFVIKDIEKGSYFLRIVSSETAYYDTEIGPINVISGQRTNIGTVNVFFKKGTIRGFIKKKDEGGRADIGVGNVKVSLIPQKRKQGFLMTLNNNRCDRDNLRGIVYTQMSEPDGSFEFKNVKVGEYKISTFDDLNGIGFLNNLITVGENESIDAGTIALVPPSALIQIEKVDEQGKAILVTNEDRVKAVFFYGDFLSEYKVSVDKSVEDEEWETISQDQYKIIDLGNEGEHKIYVRFRDIFCRETPIYSAQVFLDKTRPELTQINLINAINDFVNTINIRIGLVANDNYSGYKNLTMRTLIVDADELSEGEVDGTFFDTRQITYRSFMGDFVEPFSGKAGKKILLIQLRDEAGNESGVYKKEFYFDNIAPEFDIVVDDSKNINGIDTINSVFSTINIKNLRDTKIANIERIKVFFNSESEPQNWDTYRDHYPVILPVQNGFVDIKVRVIDSALNMSEIVSKKILIDTQSPQITLIKVNNNKGYTNNRYVTIEISGEEISEMIISNRYDFAGANWTTFLPVINYDIGEKEGPNNIFFKFRDLVGNETAVFVRDIILDTTPPCAPDNISISNSRYSVSKNRYFSNVNTPIFSWQYPCSDSEEVDRFRIEIYNASDLVYTGDVFSNNIAVPYIIDGGYRVKLYTIDRAGNISILNTPVIDLTIDTIPPTAPRIRKLEYTKTNLPEYSTCSFLGYIDIDISLPTEDDNITDFKYQISGGYDENCFYINWFTDIKDLGSQMIDDDTIRFYIANNDTTTLMIRGVDEAGNFSDIDLVTITEDSLPPGPVQNIKAENNDSKILITWEPPKNSPDTEGYLIYYGYQYDNLNGNFADEGPSPINVKKPCANRNGKEVCNFWLTGITNGTPFYIDIVAYDDTRPKPNIGEIPYSNIMVVAGILSPDFIRELGILDIGAEVGSTFESVEERDGLVYITTGNKNGNGGLHILDVSDLSRPVLLGSLKRAEFTTMHQIRLYGRYAFVANGENGVVIFDITKPNDIKVVKQISIPANTFVSSLDYNDKYLFVVINKSNPNPSNSELLIYDITNLYNPQYIKSFNLQINNVFETIVQGDFVYVGSKETIKVLDTSDINNILTKHSIDQGAKGLNVSGDRLYIVDSTRLLVYEYDLSASKFINYFSISTNNVGINVEPSATYVYVSTIDGVKIFQNWEKGEFISNLRFSNYGHIRDDLLDKYSYKTHSDIKVSRSLLFTTYYDNYVNKTGLRIYSLATPRNPRKISEYYDTLMYNRDISLYKDFILISKIEDMEFSRVKKDYNLYKVNNRYVLPFEILYTDIFDKKILSIAYEGIIFYNISHESNFPIVLYPATNYTKRVISGILRDKFLFVGLDTNIGDSYRCIEEIQIVNIQNMSLINTLTTGGCTEHSKYLDQFNAFAIYSNYLYVAIPGKGIQIYDISNIEMPNLLFTYTDNYALSAVEISVYGRYLYYSSRDKYGAVIRASLENPINPSFDILQSTPTTIKRLVPSGDFIYSGTDYAFATFDFSDNNPYAFSVYNYNTYNVSPAISGNIAFISNFNRGVMVLKLE